jgi:hypothetical protein
VSRLTCNEAHDGLTDLVEGGLEPTAKRIHQDHLKVCMPCECELESYKKTARLCGCAFEQEPSPTCCERLLETLRQMTKN